MMRIDAHQHFWHYDKQRDSWINDEMAVLKRDFLPEELTRELQANDVGGCVAVQADQSEKETLFLVELAKKNPAIRGVVGWVDLRAENLPQRLAFFSQMPLLRGFRHIVQAEADDQFMLREPFLRGIRALAEHGFTYDILVYARQLPAAVELVKRFPKQKFVIDHIAKPEIKAGKVSPWREHMREIARFPNVSCKLSGLVVEADWKNWKREHFKPYLDVVLEAFGPGRLMFGSDWPVCLLAGSYRQVKELIAEYVKHLTPAEQDRIFGLNAIEFYGLAV